VPAAFGLACFGVVFRPDLFAVVWLERGESTSTRIRSARHGSIIKPEGVQMTVMIGIDPHKATHTAVAIDYSEVVLDEFTLGASKVQASRLRDWASQFDKPEWATESANGLGYLLAQQLVAAGETVFDVSPMLASRVRVLGSSRSQKNDPNDAYRTDGVCLHRVSLVRESTYERIAASKNYRPSDRCLASRSRGDRQCGDDMPILRDQPAHVLQLAETL
jgi:hypothetical protein